MHSKGYFSSARGYYRQTANILLNPTEIYQPHEVLMFPVLCINCSIKYAARSRTKCMTKQQFWFSNSNSKSLSDNVQLLPTSSTFQENVTVLITTWREKKCPHLPHFKKKKKDVPHELNSPMTDDEPNDNALLFLHLSPFLTCRGNRRSEKIFKAAGGSLKHKICKLTLRHPRSTDWISSLPTAERSVYANDHEVLPFPCGFGHWGTIEHGLLWRLCRR